MISITTDGTYIVRFERLIVVNQDGPLAPQGTASRAVCATIIMRYMQNNNSKI